MNRVWTLINNHVPILGSFIITNIPAWGKMLKRKEVMRGLWELFLFSS